MDALPPGSGPAETFPKRVSHAISSNRTLEYCVAAIIIALALAISPVAILLLTARPELSFRVTLLSITFDLFLLLVTGALLARGRARQLIFDLIAWTLPLVVLAGLETIASAVHLANHVLPVQDFSAIKRGNNWGPSGIHLAPEKDGFAIYRPWSGNGVTINELGLRTALPTAKSGGERHVAVVGSSETWGTHLADGDTIPVLLQAALRRSGHDEISVYNFGIEDATMARQLALLRHFKDIYSIDQVVLIVGGSDLYREYFDVEGQPLGSTPTGGRITTFELYKTIERTRASWSEPSPDQLARFDARLLARSAEKKNRLADGIIAANSYCRAAALRCDFVLQPLIGFRRTPVGTETKIVQTYRRLYPRLFVLATQMYHDVLNRGLAGQVHDLTAIFDHSSEQLFFDVGHVNETGNVIFADALLPIVLPAPPSN